MVIVLCLYAFRWTTPVSPGTNDILLFRRLASVFNANLYSLGRTAHVPAGTNSVTCLIHCNGAIHPFSRTACVPAGTNGVPYLRGCPGYRLYLLDRTAHVSSGTNGVSTLQPPCGVMKWTPGCSLPSSLKGDRACPVWDKACPSGLEMQEAGSLRSGFIELSVCCSYRIQSGAGEGGR